MTNTSLHKIKNRKFIYLEIENYFEFKFLLIIHDCQIKNLDEV